jgi:hypothetical protein
LLNRIVIYLRRKERYYHQRESSFLRLTHHCASLVLSYLESEKLFHGFANLGNRVSRHEETDHFSLTVDQEFGKVPGNHLGRIGFGIKKRPVIPEVLEERVGFGSIDFDFFEENKLRVVFSFNKLQNLLMTSRFLTHELIAGESQQF